MYYIQTFINKKIILLGSILLLFACSHNKPELADLDLIEFDVTKQYPEKELEIHDLADVSYVILQSEKEFLFKYPIITVTEKFFIVNNSNGQEFLFFDRNGSPVSKLYRRGDGPEEYIRADIFLYLEEEDNLYVVVWSNNKIKLYNKTGIFKKEYSIPDDIWINGIYPYDENNLLLYFPEEKTPFGLFSKKNGEISFLTDIIIEEPATMNIRFDRIVMPDGRIQENGFFMFSGCYAVKNGNDFFLTPYPSDTAIYAINPEKQISPLLVRKPSFKETNPRIVLYNMIETKKHLFFSSARMEYDIETAKPYPKTGYLIDKNTKQIHTQAIINKDFEGKELIIDAFSINTFLSPPVGIVSYHVEELAEADEKNKLNGKLKETFDRMDKDDEYLFMIYQLK